eukprot:CFRG4906T1
MMGTKQPDAVEDLCIDQRQRELLKARMTRHGEGVSQDGFETNCSNTAVEGTAPLGRAVELNDRKRKLSINEVGESVHSTGVITRERKRKATPEKNRNAGPMRRWGSETSLNTHIDTERIPSASGVQETNPPLPTKSSALQISKANGNSSQSHLNAQSSNTVTPTKFMNSKKSSKGILSYFAAIPPTSNHEISHTSQTSLQTQTGNTLSQHEDQYHVHDAQLYAVQLNSTLRHDTVKDGCSASLSPPLITTSADNTVQRTNVIASAMNGGPNGHNGSCEIGTILTKKDLESSISAAVTEVNIKLKTVVKDLEKQKFQCAELEWEAKDKDTRISTLSKEFQILESKHTRATQAVHDLLVEEYKRRRKTLKKEVDQDSLRLVSINYKRKGTEIVENFQDGYAFQELQEKHMCLQKRKREIESDRKALLNRKKSNIKASAINNDAPECNSAATTSEFTQPLPISIATEDYYIQDEVYKLQQQQLKKEESEVLVELHGLEHSRALHLRELKRQRDESRSAYNDFMVLNDRYLLLELLGKGGFSEVYKGYDLVEMRYVACKMHVLNSQWSEDKKSNYTKHACREYNIHKSLHHQHIVSLLDVFEIDYNSFCTVLEYCEGADLDFYLKQNKTMSEREARCLITQLFSVLRYLNLIDPPVIHFDLKPANVLYHHGEIKVTDFGLSKVMEQGSIVNGDEMELTSQGAGTYWYLPPETFLNSGTVTISSKVDVWSVGVIFYQLLYGKRPFGDDLSQQSIIIERTILNARDVRFPPRPAVSSDTKDFIKLCLSYNKESRPDVLTICRHPYLATKR